MMGWWGGSSYSGCTISAIHIKKELSEKKIHIQHTYGPTENERNVLLTTFIIVGTYLTFVVKMLLQHPHHRETENAVGFKSINKKVKISKFKINLT